MTADTARTQIVSEEVSFVAGSRTIPGTLVHPESGTGPGLLLLAGSGTTDRDWNSPLLPGKNGSARLLAEALAARGVTVLRFDKAFSGQNPGLPIAELTLDTYRDEASAALDFLRSRTEVDVASKATSSALKPFSIAPIAHTEAPLRSNAPNDLVQRKGAVSFNDLLGGPTVDPTC